MNGSDTITILVWPDGCWCSPDELQQMSHKSDDFVKLTVPAECSDLQVDDLVRDHLAQ